MKTKLISFIFSFLFLFAISSCENNTETQKTFKSSDNNTSDSSVNLKFPKNTNQNTYTPPKCGNDIYPCPPYGKLLYQSMEDFPFIPVTDVTKALSDETGVVWMHNLYKLKDQGKKLLVFTISAGWCSVCATQMPIVHNMADQYKDEVAFLIVVAQDNNGAPADFAFAQSYFSHYNFTEENVFTTYDPNGLFERYMNIAAYPFNAMIDLNTMQVIAYESGLTNQTVFSNAIQSGLNKTSK